MKRYLLLLSFIILSSCAINVRMVNIPPQPGNTLAFKGSLKIPRETTNYQHLLGISYMIFLGESFTNYIDYYIDTEENYPENTLQIFIEDFSIWGANPALLKTRFIITENENVIFNETYVTKGTLPQHKAFRRSPGFRKTTDDAVNKAFEQFSQDIRETEDPRLKKIIFASDDF